MKELKVEADIKLLDELFAFINEVISPYNCPTEIQFQLEVALEEIYVNIAYYAYPNTIGDTILRCDVKCEEGKPPLLIIDIIDHGTPYNPLEEKNPDITLGFEEREIGGLGIFLVKDSMDNVSYRYEDNFNIFTIEKFLG